MRGIIRVNRAAQEISCDDGVSLLEVLRGDLGLLGTKFACGEGACGACTVTIGRDAVLACQVPAASVIGRQVTTVEGLAEDGLLHPVQQAFLELGALQCGYCTAGWIVEAAALLARDQDPSDAQIVAALDGHLCRCGTYARIVRAVRRAAEIMAAPESHLQASRMGHEESQPSSVTPTWSLAAASGEPGGDIQPLDLAPRAMRPFFEHLGEGLVVAVEAPQEAAPDERWTTARTAWLHVGSDGKVTAFTGKVELGQGTRTGLSLLVAESLGVPLSSVELVMGDTDVSPYDVGTFGSRSMPDAAPHLRRAAEAARDILLEVAAERIGTPASNLELTHGGVADRSGAIRVTYAGLLDGVRRVETVDNDTPLSRVGRWKTAGLATTAVGAEEVVTGRRRYPSDLSLPGMHYGCVLRAPAFGAVLDSLDTSGAQEVPGAIVVHDGDFVAVCAPDHRSARQALRGIKAQWSFAALPDRDGIESYLRAHPTSSDGWEAALEQESGDVRAALYLDPAPTRVTYTTAYIAHLPLEPCVAVARWDGSRATVWTGTQTPFSDRRQVALGLGVDERRVRIVVPDFGGGFGGRQHLSVSLEAARLSRAVGRPVKVQWSRWEELMANHFRPAAVIDVESATDTDGMLSAWSFANINSGTAGIATPYRVPNQHISYVPAASPLPQGPYRALAATANHFARESHMDEVAHRLGLDPLEWRLRHIDDDRLSHVLRVAAEHIGWSEGESPDVGGKGRGIACGLEKGSRIATAAELVVDGTGRLHVRKLVSVFDGGRIVNPDNLANQVEGAALMGMSGALFEAAEFSAGQLENASFSTYRLPRLSDLPKIEVVLVDRPELEPAGGGETPIVAVAPALANAIFAATGVRLRSLPLCPGGVVVRS
ncbi:MAG: molybdopterin cofactor-binding domain-containing protein [Acidimicrobiales bacterium]